VKVTKKKTIYNKGEGMKLITKEILKKLPKLYATDSMAKDKIRIYLKFFNPCGSGTWYITEFDGIDTMFGYVTGLGHDELGYISLKELSNIKLKFGLKIERDMWWDDKKTLANVMERERVS